MFTKPMVAPGARALHCAGPLRERERVRLQTIERLASWETVRSYAERGLRNEEIALKVGMSVVGIRRLLKDADFRRYHDCYEELRRLQDVDLSGLMLPRELAWAS